MTEGRVFQIQLPMRMKINKHGELESLNLNVYRNLHFYKLNYQKKAFQHYVKPLLSGLPFMEAITLHYEIHPKGGSRLDTMNVGSIVDKFFSDALVENGIIRDDDYKHVVGNSFSFGSLCPDNPHVLVTITETQPKKAVPMRILLDQSEIQLALEAFVQTMGLPGATGVELTLNGDEIQAEIIMEGGLKPVQTLTQTSTSTETQTTDQPKRRGRQPGSKNKPKGDPNVEGSSSTGNDIFSSRDTEAGEDEGEDLNDLPDSDYEPEDEELDILGESFDSSDDEIDGTGSEKSSAGSASRGNPFGDSDNESSETTSPDQKGSHTKTEAPPVTGKRPSIFDAD